MNEYARRTAKDYENEPDSLRTRIAEGSIHVWYVGSIDRRLFLIYCCIPDLLARRAQCWAESRTLIGIITFGRKRLLKAAEEITDEIERHLEIEDKYQALKHDLLTHINQRLHTGQWQQQRLMNNTF